MATLTVSTTATATIEGVAREFTSTNTADVKGIVDMEVTIGAGDLPTTLLSVTPGSKAGGSVENFKFLGIKNSGDVVCEIMMKAQNYHDNGSNSDIHSDTYSTGTYKHLQEPFISTLLYPGQHMVYQNPRMVIYNEDISDGIPESAANAAQVSTITSSTKAIGSGTDRGPTDGNGYATHATHWTETDTNGIVAGTYVINFYASGYQELGITNTTNKGAAVTESTETNAAKNTAYAFNIAVNGASAETIAFTTDSSNTLLGNPEDSDDTGVLRKIQAALNANAVTNGVTVRIINGDIRFTSGKNRMSDSAIALAAPSSGTTIFGVGIIPAIGNVDGAVAAALENGTVAGSGRLLSEPSSNHLMLDNGDGTLSRANGGHGYVDYDEGGTTELYGCPPNAEFHVHYEYDSAHSGEVSSAADTTNIMTTVYGRSVTQGKQAKIKLTAFE
tara:strand:- start:155 stop:1489 length:1335 start_codon:yes stop_codon:yes gene_type:complete